MFSPKKILVPTDFSDHASLALKKAIDIAAQNKAKIFLLHVIDKAKLSQAALEIAYTNDYVKMMDDSAQEMAKQLMAKAVASAGNLDIASEIRSGDPAAEILADDKSKGIDFIVMGSHGRKGIMENEILGSVTYKVVKSAKNSVMVAKI